MKLSIVIPFRSEDPFNNFILGVVTGMWRSNFPEAEIIISNDYPFEEKFNLARAINNGVKESIGKLLIIPDADCWIDGPEVERALEMLPDLGFILPFGETYFLTSMGTFKFLLNRDIVENGIEYVEPTREGGRIHAFRRITMVTRKLFDEVGGYNEEFVGWGWEDSEFDWKISQKIGKLPYIEDGTVYHFWHPRAEPSLENKKLFREKMGLKEEEIDGREVGK